MPKALLIVDAQVNMFEPEPAHDGPALLDRLASLVSSARAAGVPVVYVRNNGGPGDPDEPGTDGWQIATAIAPAGDEPIIDKVESDAFTIPTLAPLLRDLGADTVVVAGLQSEHCIRATARGAVDNGFAVVLVADGHSTFDGTDPATATIAAVNDQLASSVELSSAATVSTTW